MMGIALCSFPFSRKSQRLYVTRVFGMQATRSIEKFALALAALALLAVACPNAVAQDRETGGLEGQVVIGDSDEPAVAATITIINETTNIPSATKTDIAGRFSKGFLQPGRYTIRIEKEGYESLERKARVFLAQLRPVLPVIRLRPVKAGTGGEPSPPSLPPRASRPPIETEPPAIDVTSPEFKRGMALSSKTSKVIVTGRATDAAGINEVLVQDISADLDEQGNFSAEVRLRVGENKIAITATDMNGNLAMREFVVKRMSGTVAGLSGEASAPTSLPLPTSGTYHALVIGNNDYPSMPRLKTAENDAKEFAELLRTQYGFETQLLLNANRQKVVSALHSYRQKLDEGASLLIYYAGHGYKDDEAGTAYWLPVDASANDPSNWISADDMTRSIRAVLANHVLVISDSCFSGSLSRELKTVPSPPSSRQEYLQKNYSRRSRNLLSSGGDEPVADEGGNGHSVFANALLQGMGRMKADTFTGRELFNEIQESVGGASKQLPEYNHLQNSGHDGGDFIFVRKKKL